MAAPPLFTIPEEMLAEILKRNQVTEDEQQQFLEYQKKQKDRMESVLRHSIVLDELPEISEKEYAGHPMILSVSECFLERDIQLSYEEYCACVKAAGIYGTKHENYQFRLTKVKGFHNIQITCYEEKWCMVSKNRVPAIHFVIHHPKLRYALENVRLPIMDDGSEGNK